MFQMLLEEHSVAAYKLVHAMAKTLCVRQRMNQQLSDLADEQARHHQLDLAAKRREGRGIVLGVIALVLAALTASASPLVGVVMEPEDVVEQYRRHAFSKGHKGLQTEPSASRLSRAFRSVPRC